MFTCECGKSYHYRQGLSFHKKRCQYIEKINIDEDSIITHLKDIIIQQQTQISDMIPYLANASESIIQNNIQNNIQNTTQNTTQNNIQNNIQNNTQNNKISIKMFLDQHCKNAINMTDFVNSIKVTLEQLEYTTEHGLTDGLTKTIMDNINRLSIYERPLHCTDVKRETLYIKDDDKWSKDNSRERMKLAIKGATNANYRALKDWQGVHPDFRKDERLTEYFTDMILKLGRSLDGIDDKVLKNLCRSTYLKIGEFNID